MAAGTSGGLAQTCCFTPCFPDSRLDVPGVGGTAFPPALGVPGAFQELGQVLGHIVSHSAFVLLPFWEESGWTQRGHLFLTATTTSCSLVLPRVSSEKYFKKALNRAGHTGKG